MLSKATLFATGFLGILLTSQRLALSDQLFCSAVIADASAKSHAKEEFSGHEDQIITGQDGPPIYIKEFNPALGQMLSSTSHTTLNTIAYATASPNDNGWHCGIGSAVVNGISGNNGGIIAGAGGGTLQQGTNNAEDHGESSSDIGGTGLGFRTFHIYTEFSAFSTYDSTPSAGHHNINMTSLASGIMTVIYTFTPATNFLPGDTNGDGIVDQTDISNQTSTKAGFDFNSNNQIDGNDSDYLVHTILDSEYGDLDLDGDVDFSDFLILQSGLGNSGDYSDGDINGDGFVDFNDYLILQSNYGWTR